MEHICSENKICGQVIEEKKISLPSEEELSSLADFFKIFSDITREKILFALDDAPICVCEISQAVEMSISAVSHQLKILRDANLIKAERRGKNIYYSLADSHVRDIIEKALDHINE